MDVKLIFNLINKIYIKFENNKNYTNEHFSYLMGCIDGYKNSIILDDTLNENLKDKYLDEIGKIIDKMYILHTGNKNDKME